MFLDVFGIKKSGQNIKGTAKKILSAAVLAVLYSGGSFLPEKILSSDFARDYGLVNFAYADTPVPGTGFIVDDVAKTITGSAANVNANYVIPIGYRLIFSDGTALGNYTITTSNVNGSILELHGNTLGGVVSGDGIVEVNGAVTANKNIEGSIAVNSGATLSVNVENLKGNIVSDDNGTVKLTKNGTLTKVISGGTLNVDIGSGYIETNGNNLQVNEMDFISGYYIAVRGGTLSVPTINMGNRALGLYSCENVDNVNVTGTNQVTFQNSAGSVTTITGESQFGGGAAFNIGTESQGDANVVIAGTVTAGTTYMYGSKLTINEGSSFSTTGIYPKRDTPQLYINGTLTLSGTLEMGIATTVGATGTLKAYGPWVSTGITNNGIIELNDTAYNGSGIVGDNGKVIINGYCVGHRSIAGHILVKDGSTLVINVNMLKGDITNDANGIVQLTQNGTLARVISGGTLKVDSGGGHHLETNGDNLKVDKVEIISGDYISVKGGRLSVPEISVGTHALDLFNCESVDGVHVTTSNQVTIANTNGTTTVFTDCNFSSVANTNIGRADGTDANVVIAGTVTAGKTYMYGSKLTINEGSSFSTTGISPKRNNPKLDINGTLTMSGTLEKGIATTVGATGTLKAYGPWVSTGITNNGIIELNDTAYNGSGIVGDNGKVIINGYCVGHRSIAGHILVKDGSTLVINVNMLKGDITNDANGIVQLTQQGVLNRVITGGTLKISDEGNYLETNGNNLQVNKIIFPSTTNYKYLIVRGGNLSVPEINLGKHGLDLYNCESVADVSITDNNQVTIANTNGTTTVFSDCNLSNVTNTNIGREDGTDANVFIKGTVTAGATNMYGSRLTINEGSSFIATSITRKRNNPQLTANGTLSLTGSLNVGIATTVSESGTLQMGTGSLNSAVTNNGIIELHGTTLGAVINGGTGQKTGLVKIYDTVTANKKINADTLIIDDTGKLIAKKVDNLNTNNVNNYGTLEIGGTFGTAVSGKADNRGTLKFTGDALIGKSSSIVQPITYQDIDLGGYDVTVNTVAGGSLDATDNLNLNNGTIYVDGAVAGGGTGINKITLGTLTGNGCIKFNGQISASGTTSSIKVDTINASSITGDMSIDLSSVNVVGSSTDEQWAVAQTKENIPFIVSAAPITTNLVINEAYNGTSDGHMYIFEQQSPNSGNLKVTKWYGYNLAQIITDNKATADPHYPSVIDTFSLVNNTNLLTDKVHVVNGATPSITGLVDHYVTLNASGGVISTNTNLGTLVQRTDTSHAPTTRPFTINGNNYALDGGSNGSIKYDGFTVNAASPEVFLKNIKEIRGFDKYFIDNTGGTVNISGETQLNSILKGTGTYNLITGSILTVETLTNLAMTQINNSGTIKLGNATAQELTSSLATIGGIGDIIIAGNIISNAEKLSGSITINNDKQLILNGGAIKGDIQTEAAGAKNGALVITGNVTNTDTTVYDIGVKTLKINSGASLTTKANSLVGTENIINDATLTLTQDGTDIGYISADITGPTGTIIIDTGAIVNNSNNNIENILIVRGSLENYGNIAGAITVENGGNLESALEKLTSSTDIVNKGTLKIRGILNKGINKGTSAANGTIILTDDLVLSATISNQDIELNGHILTANTTACLDGTNKNNIKLNTYDTVALTEGAEGTLDTRGGSINNVTIGTLSGKGKIKLDMQLNGSGAPEIDTIAVSGIVADTTITLNNLRPFGSAEKWATSVHTMNLVSGTGVANLTIQGKIASIMGNYKYTMESSGTSDGKVTITQSVGDYLWQIVQNINDAGYVSYYALENNYTETQNNLGTLTRDIDNGQSDIFEIDGRNYNFDGGNTYSGITVDTGLTLNLTDIAEISGWVKYAVNNQYGIVNISAENVPNKTTILNSKLQGSGTYNLVSGSTLKVADACNLAMDNIRNDGKIILTGGTTLPAAVNGTGTLEIGNGINPVEITAHNELNVFTDVKTKATLNINADNFANNINDISVAGTLNITGGTLNKEIHATNGELRFSGNTTLKTRQTEIRTLTIDSGTNITVSIDKLGNGKSTTEALFKLGTAGTVKASGSTLTIDAKTVALELGHYYTVIIGDAVVGTEFNAVTIDTINSSNDYILTLANGEYGGDAVTAGKIYLKVIEIPYDIEGDKRIHNPELIKKYKAAGGEPKRLAEEIEKLYRQRDENKKELARTALNSISNLTELAEVTTNVAIFSNMVMDNTIEHASISNRSVIDRNNDSKIKNVANTGYEQVTAETIPVGMAADIIPQRLENPIYAKEIWASYLRSKNNIEDMKTGFLTKNGTNQINGVMVGADLWSNDRSFGGVSISYANSDINDSNIAAIVRNKVKNYSVGVYQRLDVNNTSALMMDLNYIQAKNDINMNVLSGYNITAEPKVNALNFGVRYETKFDLGKSSLLPYVGISYTRAKTGDYNNSYGDRYEVDNQNLVNVPVGLKWYGEYKIPESNLIWRPRIEGGYSWNIGGRDNRQYLNGKGLEFDVTDRGKYFLKTGFDIILRNVTCGLYYAYSKGEHVRSNRWNINLEWLF